MRGTVHCLISLYLLGAWGFSDMEGMTALRQQAALSGNCGIPLAAEEHKVGGGRMALQDLLTLLPDRSLQDPDFHRPMVNGVLCPACNIWNKNLNAFAAFEIKI